MHIYYFGLREHDELPIVKQLSQEHSFTFTYQTTSFALSDADKLKGADAISIPPHPLTREHIRLLHDLNIRYVLTRSIGFEHIDTEACKEYGVTYFTAKYPSDAVSEYTIMLMLMALRNVMQIVRNEDRGNFLFKEVLGRTISSCTVGVIGTGEIGRNVIALLKPFGCKILACSRHQSLDDVTYVDLHSLLQQSDIVTLHTASTPDTFHMINETTLSYMKKDAVLINTARGNLIDTNALLKALDNNALGYACLDVFEEEGSIINKDFQNKLPPHPYISSLLQNPKILLLPHTAFYTYASVYNIHLSTLNALKAHNHN